MVDYVIFKNEMKFKDEVIFKKGKKYKIVDEKENDIFVSYMDKNNPTYVSQIPKDFDGMTIY